MGDDMATIAAYLPWLWIALVIVICELGKQLRAARKDIAEARKTIARVRADRDDADATLRRVCESVEKQARPLPATDELGRPFALATWQPEPERKPS